MFNDCDDYFADGTFKSAPKGWYQLFNIWGYKKSNDSYLPLANIIMSNKSYEIYDKIIKDFLNFFNNYNIIIDFSKKSIMTDYEHSLRASIKNNIPDINIRHAFFIIQKQFIKKLKLSFIYKKEKKDTILICFILKLFPYIPTKLRKDYINKTKNYIKDLDKGYSKLLNYFEKNWINNKFCNFSEISNEEITKRTNNIS